MVTYVGRTCQLTPVRRGFTFIPWFCGGYRNVPDSPHRLACGSGRGPRYSTVADLRCTTPAYTPLHRFPTQAAFPPTVLQQPPPTTTGLAVGGFSAFLQFCSLIPADCDGLRDMPTFTTCQLILHRLPHGVLRRPHSVRRPCDLAPAA